MTFDQLEMLEAIIQKGSFKAASEALHKTQPSLSVGIKKLEDEFNLTLFDRSDYRVKLTDQGQVFYKWAKESLESFRSLGTIAKEMGNNSVEPKLVIVLDPLIVFDEIQPIFQACLGARSPTELTIRSEVLGQGMDLLIKGEADIAIGPRLKEDDCIESVFFQSIEMIPVCLKKIENEYKKYPQIVVTSPITHGTLSKGPKCFVSEHSMKLKLILSGYGWGRMAKHEIEAELKTRNLVRVNDSTVKPFFLDLYVMKNKHKPMGPIGKKLWQQLTP